MVLCCVTVQHADSKLLLKTTTREAGLIRIFLARQEMQQNHQRAAAAGNLLVSGG